MVGRRNATAFGVEEDEMVGKVGRRRYEGFEVECMKGFAC